MSRKWLADIRVFRAGMIAVLLATFAWLFRGMEPTMFLAAGLLFGTLLYRVVPHSQRASMTMSWSHLFILTSLIAVQDDLGFPAAGPWICGFLVGGIVGGYRWFGAQAGSEIRWKRSSTGEADGGFTGGWRLALINAACAVVLLGAGITHLVVRSPTAAAWSVLAVAVAAGWTLFRFTPSWRVRDGILMAMFGALLPVVILAGFVGRIDLPWIGAYGILAGILLGGRYWRGPRLGAPRPPFSGSGPRRRRKRKSRPRPKTNQAQTRKPAQSRKLTQAGNRAGG